MESKSHATPNPSPPSNRHTLLLFCTTSKHHHSLQSRPIPTTFFILPSAVAQSPISMRPRLRASASQREAARTDSNACEETTLPNACTMKTFSISTSILQVDEFCRIWLMFSRLPGDQGYPIPQFREFENLRIGHDLQRLEMYTTLSRISQPPGEKIRVYNIPHAPIDAS